MDKLKKVIKYDKKIMTFLNIIAIIGIITGSIFMMILSKKDQTLVLDTIRNFFNTLKNNQFDYLLTLRNTSITNFLIAFIIWIIGISVIGIIVVIFVVFYKCFTLGFTISSIIYAYKLKGVLISFLYVFPHLIINTLILLYLSSYSIKLSMILIKSILKKETLNFKAFFNNYIKIFLISLVFLLISSLYESFVAPYLLKLMSGFLF